MSLAGAISVVVGTCLVIPCSIGIAEYNNADYESRKHLEADRILQILILVLALVLLVVGIVLVSKSTTVQVVVDNVRDFTEVNTQLAKKKIETAKAIMEKSRRRHRAAEKSAEGIEMTKTA